VRYAWGCAPIRAILLLVGMVSLLGVPYQVLMPVFATEILHGDAHTLGMLTTASGVGAILGALYMASRDSLSALRAIVRPIYANMRLIRIATLRTQTALDACLHVHH